MGLLEELARDALARGQWIAAITHMAFARGFSHVKSTRVLDGREDIDFTFDTHRWSAATGPTKMRLDGRHLVGSLTREYIAEVLRMMEQRAPTEWPARAYWLAKVMPLHRALPAGPPPPKELPLRGTFAAAPPDWAVPTWDGLPFPPCNVDATLPPGTLQATGAELDRLTLFEVTARPPTPPGRFIVLEPGFPPLVRGLLDGVLAELRRQRRASELAAAEVTIAGVHRDMARVLLENGHDGPDVARMLRRAGVSAEGLLRAFELLEETDGHVDPLESPEEPEIRIRELAEQGRGR